MCIQQLLKNYAYFHILASALPRSEKIGIWQAHLLDPVSINLCEKNYQSIPKFSRDKGIFANCHIFGLGGALVEEKLYLSFPLSGICQY